MSLFLTKLFLMSGMLLAFVVASPVTKYQAKRDTAEVYIFSNCVNTVTQEGYAAIFWYYPDFLPDYPEPQLIGYVDTTNTVNYAGTTTTVTTPFQLSASIPESAETADVGDVVSTDCSASSYAGPMAVVKMDGEVFYYPEENVACSGEYLQRDNQGSDIKMI